MPNITLALDGKMMDLRFDMQTWETIEDEIGLVNELGDLLAKKGRLRILARLVAAMAHDPEITADWVFDHMRPCDFRLASIAVNAAIARAMKMQVEQDPGRPRDVVLEQIEKKETPEA